MQWRCVLLVICCMASSDAEARSLLTQEPVALSALTPQQTFGPFVLAPLTEIVTVHLARPTTARALNWSGSSRLRVTILVRIDGVDYRAIGQATGGVRTGRQGEAETYRLSYTLPYGFFGRRAGFPTRLGEGASVYQVVIRLDWLRGEIVTTLEVSTSERGAPAIPFHSSVAFDTASSAQEVSGDGVLSLSHTSSGSDRGVFAGVSVLGDGGVGGSTSVTYGGTGMAEQWDNRHVAFQYNNAGYTLAGQATGAQTVTSTLAGTEPLNHALGVISMTGVDQATPVGTAVTAEGTTSPATVTVGSVGTDDLVVDNMLTQSFGAPTVGADQTEQYAQTFGASNFVRGSTQPGSAGGVMSWTVSGPDLWMTGGIAFKPVAVPVVSGCRLLQNGTDKRLLQSGSPNGRIFQGGGSCDLGAGGGLVPTRTLTGVGL